MLATLWSTFSKHYLVIDCPLNLHGPLSKHILAIDLISQLVLIELYIFYTDFVRLVISMQHVERNDKIGYTLDFCATYFFQYKPK